MAGSDGIEVNVNALVEILRAKRAELVELLRKVDLVLEAFDDLSTAPVAAPSRKGGKWRPGGRGRPPKAFVEKQAEKQAAKEDAAKPPKRKRKRRKGSRKPPTEKQLAALAKARAAMAAKRAKATAS